MESLTSRQHPLLRHLRTLACAGAQRRQQGEILCEGPKLWQEAVASHWAVGTVLGREDKLPPDAAAVAERLAAGPSDLLAYVADTKTPQGFVFTCRLPEAQPIPSGSRWLILDGVQDPGNVGTIWRSADALGADALLLLPGCADPRSPTAIRATMAAIFRLPLLQTDPEGLAALLHTRSLPLYVAALGPGAVDVRSVRENPVALVIGSEGRGVSQEILDLADGRLTIPMRARCESLNAAAAAAIVLWELWGRNAPDLKL